METRVSLLIDSLILKPLNWSLGMRLASLHATVSMCAEPKCVLIYKLHTVVDMVA